MNDMTAALQLREVHENTFRTHDGVDLFYRHWPAVAGTRRDSTHSAPRRAILLFHRGHEHSARMAHLVDELELPDYDFFAWDARGHGRSPGARGDSPSFGMSVRDVQTFVDHIVAAHDIAVEDIGIIAQSVGAVLVAAWVHDYAPAIRGMVLASPAFRVKLYVPLALPGLRLMRGMFGNFFVTSYVKAKFLTRDAARIESYGSDPLLSRSISVNVLLGLQEAADRVVADAQAITVPTQLLISGADWVVHHGPQHEFFDRLGAQVKERHVLHGFLHDTLGERDRARALLRVRAFIVRAFSAPRARMDLLDADQHGHTREEADALAAPLPALSPRGLYWAATRANLRLGGVLADGIRLGHATGFDSGSTLDYIYRNQASGRTLLGRMADRTYLDAIGWRGIRQRKLDVEALLCDAITRLRAIGAPVHIVDIAAGHGRYVLDAIATLPELPDSILLRDYIDLNVERGTALITERGLSGIARFELGDAFDRASLAALSPRPTLAVVSGLFELMPDNAPVRACLGGLADAIDTGGYVVYTGQPWHPQLELIARALTSHRQGAAWVMRRRTQEELDQLVAAAGFRKVAQRIGESGIFTVSLAQRVKQ
jgi:alpha-beta hydrolase superfamily lysophospholipase